MSSVKLLRPCLFPALTSYYSSVIRPLDILLISWKYLLTGLSSSLNLNSSSAWVALVHFYNPITEPRFLKIQIFITERRESMNIHFHGSIDFSPDSFLLSSSQTKKQSPNTFYHFWWPSPDLFDLKMWRPELLRVNCWCCTTAARSAWSSCPFPLLLNPAAATLTSSVAGNRSDALRSSDSWTGFSSLMDCGLLRGRQLSYSSSYSHKGEKVTFWILKDSHLLL